MKLKLIMNPGSRSGKGRRLWETWFAALRAAGVPFESIVTERPGDAFEIAKAPDDTNIVVAVGGDGTINEVLDGVMQSGNPKLRMGVLYSGTSPDFCSFHGIPVEPRKAIASLAANIVRSVDVVRIEHSEYDGSRKLAHFGCGCNIGLGADVARLANRTRKFLGDRLGTGISVIRALITSQQIDLELHIDGIQHPLSSVNNLSILKCPYIASGLKLNLDLLPDDGTLQLIGLQARSKTDLFSLLPGFYSGNAVSSQSLFIRKCFGIRIDSQQRQEIEYDGDPHGFLPAEIHILPRALKLIGSSHDGI